MTGPVRGPVIAAAQPRPEHERLRQAARDLEGVFVEQMFKAMRETVPDGGVVDGGSGEEMFTTLLDQRLSAAVPGGWERGLSEALYRQLAAGSQGPGTGDQGPGSAAGPLGPRSPIPGPPTASSSALPSPILPSDTSTLPELP